MLNKYRLFQRANGVFYWQDNESGKQRSLRTKDRRTAEKQAASNGEGGLVRLTDSPENQLLSECCTQQGLRLEQQAVKYVNDTRNTCPALDPRFAPAAHLSEEQKKVVTSILSTRDRVFSFRGVAGSGKTTTLREVQRGLRESGHTVFAVSPTASAARMLRSEGFAEATTVEDFLRLTDQGQHLDRCLAVSFTWDENHRFTDSIRRGLRERGVLPAEGTRLEVHESLRWTNQQKGNCQRYELGQVVTFAPGSNRSPLRPQSCASRKGKSSWPLLLGKKGPSIYYDLIPSMSPAHARSKSLPATGYSSAPTTSGLVSLTDRC